MSLKASLRWGYSSLFAAVTGTAIAVGTMVIGGANAQARDISGSPGVVVDGSVLNALGPALTVPDLMLAPESRPYQPPQSLAGTNAMAGLTGGRPQQLLPDPDKAPQSRLMVPMPGSGSGLGGPPRVSVIAPQVSPTTPTYRPVPAQPATPAYVPPANPEPIRPQTPQPPTPEPQSPASTQASAPPAPPPARAPAPAPEPETAVAPPPPPESPAPQESVVAVTQGPNGSVSAAPSAPTVGESPAPSQQTASLPPPTVRPAGVTIAFGPEDTSVPAGASSALDGIADRMGQNPGLAVRVEAYASGGSAGKSRSRRLALSRALSVRTYLLDKGIEPERVEVRALGTAESGAPDRVDIAWVTN